MRGLAPRRGREHRDQGRLGHPAAGRGHAGVADERALADLHPLDAQPAAAELVAADQGVVGQERLVVDLGQRRDHQHRRRLDVLADPGAEQPQPGRRQARGVEREQPGAGVVEHPHRRPDRERRAAAHRVDARSGPRAPATRTTSRTSSARAAPGRPATDTGSQPSRPSRSAYAVGSSASSTGERGAREHRQRSGRRESSTATAPYAAIQAAAGRRPVRPRSAGPLLDRAGPGSPDQYSPSGTTPNTDDPAPPRRPCRRRHRGRACCARRPGRGRRPGPAPRCTTSPSIQKPLRSTSGSIEQPVPSRSMPVTGGTRVQVDVAADLGAEQPREPGHVRRAGQPGRPELVDHPLGQPQPQVHLAAARVVARLPTLRSSSRAPAAASSIRPGGVTKTSHAEGQQPPATAGEQRSSRAPSAQQPGADPDPDQPARAGQRAQQAWSRRPGRPGS